MIGFLVLAAATLQAPSCVISTAPVSSDLVTARTFVEHLSEAKWGDAALQLTPDARIINMAGDDETMNPVDFLAYGAKEHPPTGWFNPKLLLGDGDGVVAVKVLEGEGGVSETHLWVFTVAGRCVRRLQRF